MSTLDDMWAVIYPPLQELRAETIVRPDKSWDDRRWQFLEKLGLSDPAQDPVVDALIRRLDELSDDQRDELLRTDQLDSLAYQLIKENAPVPDHPVEPAPSAVPVVPTYDEAVWATYLATNGPAWNGLADSWSQYRKWFLYYAAERGVEEPATALLNYLESQSVADRITTFARYGVTIQPVRTVGTGEVHDESTRPNGGGGAGVKRAHQETAGTGKKSEPSSSSSSGKRSGSRLEESNEDESLLKRRRSSRIQLKEASLGPPTLTITSEYIGAATQQRYAKQNLMFRQTATLTKPHDAPQGIQHYYEFRQEVRDGFQSQFSPSEPVSADFEQDGPFQPDYDDPMVTVTANSITFEDTPGFSTDRAIDAGDWVNSYDVYFRWRVKRVGQQREWVSPVVHHSLVAPYDNDNDVAVQANPAGNFDWEVDLSE